MCNTTETHWGTCIGTLVVTKLLVHTALWDLVKIVYRTGDCEPTAAGWDAPHINEMYFSYLNIGYRPALLTRINKQLFSPPKLVAAQCGEDVQIDG